MTVPKAPRGCVPKRVPEVEGVERTLRGPDETLTLSLMENLVETTLLTVTVIPADVV